MKERKSTAFLLLISILSCMIIHYIVEENIFVVIVGKLLQRQKNCNAILKIPFKINSKQTIKMPKKDKYIKFKIVEKKSSFMIYADFQNFLVPEDNQKQNQISLMLTNIKNMLLVDMVNLVSPLNHT